MTETTDLQAVRIPYCHKIRYGITGAPILTEDEMEGSHAPEVGVDPALIELIYSAARDGKPASVGASVTGWWTRFGVREQPERQVTTHFKDGPDGWPGWLAEEARLHDPDATAAPSAPAARAAGERAVAYRSPGTRTLYCVTCARQESGWQPVTAPEVRDATVCDFCGGRVLVVASRTLGNVVARYMPAPVDRAAVLRESADALGRMDYDTDSNDYGYDTYRDAWNGGVMDGADLLRRKADEAQQPEAEPCGAWGGCTLARGHNIGQADIPENHRAPQPAVGARQADTAGEQQ